ncbi:3'-5'-exoribonuclease [Ophidiomyces ophidiicola]|nr:3'-5'-exoribonuclease [Ophidiomyces ophidiicola]
MEAAGSHGKGKAAASKSGGRAKSSSKVNNSKMTTTTTTTGRNPGDAAAAAAAAACRQRKASVKLETATGREEYTANKENSLQRQACDGHENDGDYENDDDDDDVPLAIKRRMALSTKRPAAADLAAESKRRKLGLGDDECSLSRVGGITSDLEIIAVAPVTAAAAGSGSSSSNGWGAAAFTTMGGRDETLFRELPLRPWPGHHQQNKNKNTQGWRLAQEHAVTSSDPPVPRAPLLARASDPAEKNNKNKNTIASSPGDTISLASSTSSSSLSLMDRPSYDDDSNANAGLAAWRPARVPQIVITDMEPHAPRNWLNPRSAAAIGKAEQAVNLALFGPGSQAFRRAPAGVPERGRGERAGEAVRRYLAVPWSAVEENPRRAREYIVIE